jgi:molecular chaperone GrpE
MMPDDTPEQPTDVLNPPAPESVEAPPSARQASPEEQIEDLRQKWLFAQADLDNYRKRAAKDLEQERLYRSLPLARDLLPALDNLRRALDAAKAAPDAAQLAQGVQLVLQQMENTFDPNLHQAIQQVPSEQHPPGTVVAEYQKGYTLHDRVIRPSTVVVAAPKG